MITPNARNDCRKETCLGFVLASPSSTGPGRQKSQIRTSILETVRRFDNAEKHSPVLNCGGGLLKAEHRPR